MEFDQFSLDDEESEQFTADEPRLSDPGRILFQILGPSASPYYRWEIEILDFDGSAFWIGEGEGFDWWLNKETDLELPGYYVIEGIVGTYIRGNWSWGEDDDTIWDWKLCRRASEAEVASECLS